MKRIDTKKLATLSLLISVAMILSYIESLIPPLVAVPGVKLGLSNIATVFALYALGAPAAVTVSLLRVLLSALLFGSFVSLIYSFSGALLALALMILIRKIGRFSSVGVSVVGGVTHNIGQILMAMLLLETAELGYYLVVLTVTGTISGILIGLCGALLIKRVPKTYNI